MPTCRADDGCRLAYAAEGPASAPIVVLLHALGTDRRLWDGVAPHLARDFCVIRCDARGHGASEAAPAPYEIARLGQDVLAVLDAVGAGRAHVCGLSIGGLTALWLAARAPARVGRVVLANTAARIGTPALWDERIGLVAQHGLAAVADATLARWFTARFRAGEPETVARWRDVLMATPPPGYLAACAALRDADLRADAALVEAPALVLTGTHDVSTPPTDGAWLAGAIAGATLVELDAAHLAAVEAAALFAEALGQFLRG